MSAGRLVYDANHMRLMRERDAALAERDTAVARATQLADELDTAISLAEIEAHPHPNELAAWRRLVRS